MLAVGLSACLCQVGKVPSCACFVEGFCHGTVLGFDKLSSCTS